MCKKTPWFLLIEGNTMAVPFSDPEASWPGLSYSTPLASKTGWLHPD